MVYRFRTLPLAFGWPSLTLERREEKEQGDEGVVLYAQFALAVFF